MKKYLVLAWLLFPLPLVVLHYGRGQQWLAIDRAGDLILRAEEAERAGDWRLADDRYRDADKEIGAGDPALKLRLELARVRTRFRLCEAVAAIDGVDKLLDDAGMAAMPPEFQREARDFSGRIHYYAGWVMRLEGAKRELWMEEAELSRQNFRLLAEQSTTAASSGEATKQKKNLEAAVQLQRLSLTELITRPLPREGRSMGGQGLSEQMAKRRGQRGGKPGQGRAGDKPGSGGDMKRFEPGQGS